MASLGAGYSVSRALLSDGSAYVAKGTTVAHVNGESGKLDAQMPGNVATGKQGVQVVKLPSGQLIVVNQRTLAVTAVDASTMKPVGVLLPGEQAPGVLDRPTAIQVIPSGQVGWLVDAIHGYVALIGDHGKSTQVSLSAGLADAAPGPDGSVIVLTKDGVVIRVGTDLSVHRMPITDGAGGTLTSAGGHCFLFTSAGEVLMVDGDQPRTLAKPDGLDANVIAGSPQGAGDHVLAIEHDVLLLIDANSGATQNIALHSDSATLGRPVELGGRVYIPDYTNHRLLVANEDTGQLQKAIDVPGSTPTFALFVSGGRVWANDQFSQRMVAVDAAGVLTRIDKGTGKGVEDPDAKPTTKTPTTKTPKTKTPKTKTPTGTTIPKPNPGGHSTPIPNPVTVIPRPGTPIPVVPPATPPKKVAVPSFGPNTNYVDACAQIEALQLHCAPVAVDANGKSGNTGDVVDTVPGGGSQVEVGSQVVLTYLGQLVVPNNLVGSTPDEACAAVVAAQLTCKLQASPIPVPANTPEAFGIVDGVNPASGSKANSGAEVTVSYPNTFQMPDFTNQAGAGSCAALIANYTLTVNGTTTKPNCATQTGTTAPTAAQAGQVYVQNPLPAVATPANASVALTVYNGKVHVPTFTGEAGAALVACQATAGLTCTLVDGNYPGGNPAAAGTVESQTPATGDYDVVAAVQITRFRTDNLVPNVTGGDKDAGCAQIQASGYTCGPLQDGISPTQNQVVSQDQAAGSPLPLGATVTYHYSPYQALPLINYQANNGDPVWVTRIQGDAVPAGYGANPQQVGSAYRAGQGPGAYSVTGFFCTASVNACNGYDPNHMASRAPLATIQAADGASWQAGAPLMDLWPPVSGACPGGTVMVFRAWWFSGATHQYRVTTNPAGATGSEALGCIWP